MGKKAVAADLVFGQAYAWDWGPSLISNATAHGRSVHQLVVLLSATEILGLTYQRANCFSVAFFSRLVFFNKSPIGVQAPPVFMHILFVVPMFGRFWACSAGLKPASQPVGLFRHSRNHCSRPARTVFFSYNTQSEQYFSVLPNRAFIGKGHFRHPPFRANNKTCYIIMQ